MDENSNRRELVIAGLLLLLVITIGVLGYIQIDNFSFIDSLYMTVITISTVGYGEVKELTDGGKLFTSGLILASLVILGYFISIITQNLVHSQLSFFYAINNKKNRAKKMENHVIVVGYGRNGKQVVNELLTLGLKIIVIDQNHELIINNMGRSARFIEGDATNDEVLVKAGINTARSLISTLPNDADNLYVVLTARSLKHDLKIISRASNDSSEKKLRMAGVDNVVMPERVGGAHMATLIAQPDIVEFLDHLSIHSDTPTQLVEIMCDELPFELINKPIREIGIRRKSGANIIGFKTATGDFIINPSPETKLMPNSKLFVLGTKEQISHMREIMSDTGSQS
ncbi:MAG: potassium channel protein [Bacteroidetes bacterium]|nr:potassium channel protein [Bacteroidota bacterium]MBL6944066.1 potassium channel protein [Bacteroidales bacterium]